MSGANKDPRFCGWCGKYSADPVYAMPRTELIRAVHGGSLEETLPEFPTCSVNHARRVQEWVEATGTLPPHQRR